MKKFKEYIEKWLDGQKVRGIQVSLLDIRECVRIYHAMVRNEKPEFINGKVKEILDKHNCEYGIDSVIDDHTTFYFKLKKSK